MAEFPLQLDTDKVEFASEKLGEEACSSDLKVTNPHSVACRFRITASSSELFSASPDHGTIMPGEAEAVKLIFNAAGEAVPECGVHYYYELTASKVTSPKSREGSDGLGCDKEPDISLRLGINFCKKKKEEKEGKPRSAILPWADEPPTPRVEPPAPVYGPEPEPEQQATIRWLRSLPHPGPYLALRPEVVTFPGDTYKTTVKMVSRLNHRLAYKVKTTNNDLYRAKPVFGFVPPNGEAELELMAFAPPTKKDHLYVYYLGVDADETREAAEIFKNAPPHMNNSGLTIKPARNN